MANGQQQVAGSAFSKNQVFMAISAVFIGYFINSYFMQSMQPAVPKIATALHGFELFSWSMSIPALGLAVATLLGGKLSDIFGRRALLMAAMIFILLGTIWCALCTTIELFIIARTFQSLGFGIASSLCYTVIGDIFSGAAQRSKWMGLLGLPMGLALIGLIVGPMFVDHDHWQWIFWCSLPFIVLCIIFIYRMPPLIQGSIGRIDVAGIILVTLSSSCIITGLSLPGIGFSWGSKTVIGLLALAVITGALFLIAESRAKEPLLYLDLLKNRTFMTISIAGFLSFFGMTSIGAFFQAFMQAIQNRTTSESAGIGQFPVSVLMAFIGIPVGFLVARTKRYKPLIVTGYGLAAVAMIGMIFLGQETFWLWELLIAMLAGLGLGAIPTINTLLIPAAVPRKLMGSAMAVLFFSISIGMAIAVAIQGSAMNIWYSNSLNASLPKAITDNREIMDSISDYHVLLNAMQKSDLQKKINNISDADPQLFDQTISSIRSSAVEGLRVVFITGGVTMALAFLLILTIPAIPLDRPPE
jgi:MFS family permease